MDTSLLAFLITCVLIELTPGPNMAYLAILSLGDGRRAGYAATGGVALGLLIVGLVAAFGLAAAVSRSALFYEVLRAAGIGYLLYLAWQGWRDADNASIEGSNNGAPLHTYFVRGLVTNLLNPKAAMFYVAILPPFIDASRPVLPQTLTRSLLYVLVATAIHGLIVSLAGFAREILANSGLVRLLRRGLSAALALVAVWFAVTTAR